jgi:phage terminase large subunit-like protein
MQITPEMRASVPFQYAYGVLDGTVVTGNRIKQAVQRFFRWIDEADDKGFALDHKSGMAIIKFFPACLNHTVGKLQGKPFHLVPFQQFTMYNIFGWKNKATGKRRISTVYDCRGKKNGKTAEMAGLSLFMMSMEMVSEAQVFIGATVEHQAKLCLKQAKSFINNAYANPMLKAIGFYTQRDEVIFGPLSAKMKALNKDPDKQDGIQVYLGIVDEYHAHPDDRIKENMQSATVLFDQPLMYHITTRGFNLQSPCRRYEDEMILPVLDGIVEVDHIFAMIHEMDAADLAEDPKAEKQHWEFEENWVKANPLLGQGLDIAELRKFYNETTVQLSKRREFKTKNLNMWLDAPSSWILGETWDKCRHDLTPNQVHEKFLHFGGYAGGDLSTKLDITAFVMLSEPDAKDMRYIVPFFFCPKETIFMRSKVDKVPYVDWMDKGLLIATEGNRVDYREVAKVIRRGFHDYNIERVEFDPWNASDLLTMLQEPVTEDTRVIELPVNVSELGQTMAVLNDPTKEFEALVADGKIRHDGNPILKWMISRCVPIYDSKGNMMIRKGDKTQLGSVARIDGIAATINALAGSMTGPGETNESAYNKMTPEEIRQMYGV